VARPVLPDAHDIFNNNHPDHRATSKEHHPMSDNTVTLIGNITRDPEIRFTPGGRAQTSFGLAVNRRYQQSGEWVEHTSFFNVVAWGSLAENVAASFPDKGTRVFVTGRLEHRTWDTESGEKRHTVEIVADDIGPSLRWATCEVTRITRTNDTDSNVDEPADDTDTPATKGRR
jgi:single-strand DNA-binding protein